MRNWNHALHGKMGENLEQSSEMSILGVWRGYGGRSIWKYQYYKFNSLVYIFRSHLSRISILKLCNFYFWFIYKFMTQISILFLFLLGHGTSFNVDCNICSCFAGNLVCSTRLCLSEHSSEDDRRTFTGNRGHPAAFLILCTHSPLKAASH